MPAPPSLQALLASALRHHQAGRLDDARQGYREVLRRAPDHADALQLLGTLEGQDGHVAEAVALLRRSLDLDPRAIHARRNLAALLRQAGHLEEALSHYQHIWSVSPDETSRVDLAHACNEVGNLLDDRGDLEGAEAALRQALALCPDLAVAWSNLGDTLRRRGRLGESLAAHRQALERAPGVAEIHSNMGHALFQAAGPGPETMACFQRAIALNPRTLKAWLGLGNVLQENGQVEEAVRAYRQALILQPNQADVENNLGRVLTLAGRFREARQHFEQALQANPRDSEAHSGLIFSVDLDPSVTPREAYAERRRYHERHAAPLAAEGAPHDNGIDPDRRLKVGYVSADFCHHSAAHTFGPVLFAHDPREVEVWCFSEVVRPDATTARFREVAGARWISTVGMTDTEMARLVRQCGIDILVDLSGHSAGNRLPVFARRPAPVQVTAWGYATGTGLDAMDYIIADDFTLPPELEPCYSERPVRLPCVLCYHPLVETPPVTALPAAATGAVTFGCFNRYSKVTPEMLTTWARILHDCARSRLLLKAGEFDDERVRAEVLGHFGARGIDPARVDLLGKTSQAEHQGAYGRVDIGLDPYPFQGGISSLESLWMGVPFVTLPGERAASRLGAVFLSRLGLQEWIAPTLDNYVALAQAHARDLEMLASIRAGLRSRMAASPLGNPDLYCRHVETAYREMWRAWCASTTGLVPRRNSSDAMGTGLPGTP